MLPDTSKNNAYNMSYTKWAKGMNNSKFEGLMPELAKYANV